MRPMRQRILEFKDRADVVAELERLRRGGYTPRGKWDLFQMCDHLAYFVEGSLDGHQFTTPWLFKALFGRLFLRRILKTGKMKSEVPRPQKRTRKAGGAEAAEAAAASRRRRGRRRRPAHLGARPPIFP